MTAASAQGVFNLRILLVLSLGHLVTDIYQGALPSILPFLRDRLDLSYTMAGVIMMASSVTSSVIQPLFGYLSDRKEKPLLLPLGCLSAGAGFCLLPLTDAYAAVLLLVAISGFGVASYHPEGYKTAFHFTGRRKVTGMSIFAVGGNLGFAIGPVIAIAIISYLGFSYLPLMIALAIIFAIVVRIHWSALMVPAPSSPAGKQEASRPTGRAVVALSFLIAAVVMRSWTQFGLMTYIPFYYIDHLKGDPLYAGMLVSVFLLGGGIGTLLGAPLADRWGHKPYLVTSLMLAALILPLIFVVDGVALFAVLGLLGMVLISSFSVTIVMAQHLLPGHLGIASGLMVGFAIGTGGLGVTVLGVVADRLGVPAALQAVAALPVGGLVLAASIRYRSAGTA